MSVSLWILTGLILLIMFGAGQRILDQMRLNDKQALVVLLSIVVGIIIPPIYINQYFCFSIGGFLIPFIISVYMLFSCGWSRDLIRAIVGTILVAGIIYGLEWLMPAETAEDIVIDPMFVYGIVAGIVAYVLGRSRRNAFICSVFGISLAMLVQFIINMAMGTPTVLGLGVGGAFGTTIISTIISVALCEFLGRAFETAKKDEGEKVFNFETHTYDSTKNGKLNSDGTKAVLLEDGNEKVTTSDTAKLNKKSKAVRTETNKATNKNTKKVVKNLKYVDNKTVKPKETKPAVAMENATEDFEKERMKNKNTQVNIGKKVNAKNNLQSKAKSEKKDDLKQKSNNLNAGTNADNRKEERN